MKLKTPTVRTACCLTLPVFLLLAGCDNGSKAPDAGTTSSSAETNNAATVSANSTPNADNSALNARDRNGATLTPGDQGNSESDRIITQKIRQGVVNSTNAVAGTNDLSIVAKNIKIITTNGKVTLRGPVNSADEKSSIESIAKSIAGDANVDDQLEVKTNP